VFRYFNTQNWKENFQGSGNVIDQVYYMTVVQWPPSGVDPLSLRLCS